MKEPNIGDTVKVTTPDYEEEGVVTWKGASQFTYTRGEQLPIRFCSYSGVWEIVNKSEVKYDKAELKTKAKELYESYKNYAKVAKELGLHPTTIRTWLKK